MALTLLTGWEIGISGTPSELVISGTSSISTTQARTGSRSLRCNPASGASGYCQVPTATYLHFGMYVATLPSVDRIIFGATGAGSINFRLTTTGAIAAYLNTTLIGTSSTAFSATGWHWVGLRLVTGTSAVFLQIDGVNEVTGTATITSVAANVGAPGTEASSVDLYVDDVMDDDTGLLQPSKVALLVPISDNARTAWTDANGGTSNLWDCVNNIPPAGVASANEAANPTASIKSPASSAGTYTANLTSYSTAGVAAGSTVLAVQTVFRHGEDIATGTKTGTIGATTNPTITGSAVTFGDDVGAHGAEAGNWVSKRGTLTLSPTVTLGTSPTMDAVRPSEARVACVDFMGMYVAWTPAASTLSPPFRSKSIHNALVR